MVMEAMVKDDGTLIANIPESLWGKRVYITLAESILEKQEKPTQSQWDKISTVLHEARTISTSRRTADAILNELRDFRESQ